MALSQSLGDFVVASAGPHRVGHCRTRRRAQTLSRSGCAVLNIDIGGGTSNYALFDAGNLSATACLNVGGRLLETDAQGAWSTRTRRTADCRCGIRPGTDALSLTAGQLAQVARRMAGLIVEVIDGRLSPLAQGLMQTEVLPAGVQPEVITLSGGVGSATAINPPILSVFPILGRCWPRPCTSIRACVK